MLIDFLLSQHQFPYQAGVLMFLPSIGGNALCGEFPQIFFV
jgi:hypothetical protein